MKNQYLEQNFTLWIAAALACRQHYCSQTFVMRINELANPNANKTAFFDNTRAPKMRCRRDLINEAKDSKQKKSKKKKNTKEKKWKIKFQATLLRYIY